MENILIRTNTLPHWIDEKYFKGTDLATIEDLISIIEDLQGDVERLEEELEDLKRDVEDNYRFVPMEEQVGISDKDFI